MPAEFDRAEDIGFEVVDEEDFKGIGIAQRGERGLVNRTIGFQGFDLVRIDAGAEKREEGVGGFGMDDVGFVGVGDDGERIMRRQKRGEGDVLGERCEDFRKHDAQFLRGAFVFEAFFEVGEELGGGDGAGFVGDGLGVFFEEAGDFIRAQRRFFRDAVEHDFPVEMEEDFAEVEADGADFHGREDRTKLPNFPN